MKKRLKKETSKTWYYDEDGVKVDGIHDRISGNVSKIFGNISGISGNVSKISGDVSGIYGNVSKISGNVSGISGDVSGISGNVDECEITNKERSAGIDIGLLVNG